MAEQNFNKNNNQELVDVYMPISREEAKAMGYKNKDIVIRRIGIKNVPCIKTQGTSEFAARYATMLDTEQRGELREKRCLIADKKGGFIRCPECNHCSECEKHFMENFTTNKPLSLEKLTEGDSEEDKTFDIAGQYETEADITTRIILEDLLGYLGSFEGKHYAEMFQMLYEQYSVKEIAEELGLAWSTTKDAIKKVRKLAQEFTGLEK